jgi:hypothetical protein
MDLSSQRGVDTLLGVDDILVECDQIVVGDLVRSSDGSERTLNLVRSEVTRSSLTFNNVTKDVSFHTTTSRFVVWLGAFSQERQKLWSPKDELQDSASWSSTPLVLLRDIHNGLLTNYNFKDTEPPQSQSDYDIL